VTPSELLATHGLDRLWLFVETWNARMTFAFASLSLEW
jgi:hypothetical protein